MNNDLDVLGILTALGVLAFLFVVPAVVLLRDAARGTRPDDTDAGGDA